MSIEEMNGAKCSFLIKKEELYGRNCAALGAPQ